jgi:hypothetical protein
VTGKNEGTLKDGESEKSIEADMSLSISSCESKITERLLLLFELLLLLLLVLVLVGVVTIVLLLLLLLLNLVSTSNIFVGYDELFSS